MTITGTIRSAGFFAGAILFGLGIGANTAPAQIACVIGLNANACTVAPGVDLNASVNTNGDGETIGNAGRVDSIDTDGNNAAVTNSGLAFGEIDTSGMNSPVFNSGTVGENIVTRGANSPIFNFGSVGEDIVTEQDNSPVTNTGSVVDFIRTENPNSAVTNSGTVGTSILTDDDNSPVNNSGTAGTFIRTNGTDSFVTNSGAVGSGAAGDGILLNAPGGTLTLLPGSVIQGVIDIRSGGTVPTTLNVGNGLSIANSFEVDVNSGVPVIINSSGAPFAVSGAQVAVVDPTNLAMQDEVLTGLTGGIFSSLHNRLNGFGQGGVSGVTSNPRPMSFGGKSQTSAMIEDTSRQGWVQAFGSYRLQREDGPAVDSDIRLGGVVSGIDGATGAGGRAGIFFGGSWGDVDADFDSQETDVESVFGGLYARWLRGNTFIDLALTAGYSDYGRERRVANNLAATGIQTAKADYDGFFVSPEVTWTRPIWVKQQRMEKSLTLRYAGLFLDGFTETGSAAPLTVDDRDIHVLQARSQLTMPVVHEGPDGSRRKSAFYIGLEGRANVGDGDVSGVLLGQNINFDPGGDDVVGGAFAGLQFERTSASGTTLYANIEGQVETGGGRQASAKTGIKFRF